MDAPSTDAEDRTLDVCVAVVTWNSAAVIGRLLASLPGALTGLKYRVVVADNASTDGTVEVVRTSWPDVTVVETGRNAGYAAGINAAVRAPCPARATLICNPDVQLRPGAVRSLLRALDDPDVGIVVPRLVGTDGETLPSLRRRPTVLRAMGEAVLGGERAGRFDRLGETVHRTEMYRSARDVDWATGAVMLVDDRCREVVGEWDESFFLYSEETDFALRAHDAGFRVRYVPESVAVHGGGDLHRSPELWRLQALNRVRLFARRHGPVATRAFWAAVTLNEGLRALAGRPGNQMAYRALRELGPMVDRP
ncbi:MAG: glycosyltransferase family 2 protein [Actinobacteria bacterium]|nr:glycosyltransferase family 2 protein [Actinomycetota bacterium]